MILSDQEKAGVDGILVPYAEFDDSERLAFELQSLVAANAGELRTRHMIGVLTRYAATVDLETIAARIDKAKSDETVGHYAVVNDNGTVKGAASIHYDLGLRRLHLPLAPKFARGPLAMEYDCNMNPNIAAWTNGDIPLLGAAYRALVQLTGTANRSTHAWTIEPKASSASIHGAIVMGGLMYARSGRFDDNESRRTVPPISDLYIVPQPQDDNL